MYTYCNFIMAFCAWKVLKNSTIWINNNVGRHKNSSTTPETLNKLNRSKKVFLVQIRDWIFIILINKVFKKKLDPWDIL